MDTNQQHKDHNNTKTIWKAIVLCNTPCFKLKSKKTAKNNPSPIVIPSRTAKKFPKYRFQSTWEGAFQHSKIETRVQHITAKEHFKERITMHSNGQNTRTTARTRFKVSHILLWGDTAASACASAYDIYTHGFARLKNHHHDTCTRTATWQFQTPRFPHNPSTIFILTTYSNLRPELIRSSSNNSIWLQAHAASFNHEHQAMQSQDEDTPMLTLEYGKQSLLPQVPLYKPQC